MVVGSEEMENADNGCFMPIISSEKDSEIFFSKLKKIFIVKNSLLEKEGLTPLILKAFESKHINVKHKHREKELEILFFENKQELYNSINKP